MFTKKGFRAQWFALSAAFAVAALGAPQSVFPAAIEPVISSPLVSAEQLSALRGLANVRTVQLDARGVPAELEADLGTFRNDPALQAADAETLMRGLRKALRASGAESLRLRRSNLDAARGMRHYRMAQTIRGLEVIGGEVILHVRDGATAQVTGISAQFLPDVGLAREPAFVAEEALRNGLAEIGARDARTVSAPRLAYARTPDGNGYLVWVARIEYTDVAGDSQLDDILVDAATARFVQRLPQKYDALNRQVRNYGSGSVLVNEGGTTTDVDAQHVYQFTGDTYNYYFSNFGRDSWNGAGALMRSYVHGTSDGQNNANFTPGNNSTNFGNGNGTTYGSFANGRDIVGHEWTHAVTSSEANLTYSGESGAINESMSDIFGAAVEAASTGVGANTWRVGEDVYTPATPGDALRYMGNPTQDGHSRDYYPQLQSGDDVHYGSGIGNLAFYLLTTGGTHPRGMTSTVVTGIGIANASRIFYLALRDYLQSSSNYAAAREQTGRVASEQFGVGSVQHVNTCNAWVAVGVPDGGTYCDMTPPTSPPLLHLNTLSSTSVNIGWSASTDTGGSGVAGYRVYRNGAQIGTTASLTYVDATVVAGTTYNYSVAAYDSRGNVSAQTGQLQVIVPTGGGSLSTITVSNMTVSNTVAGSATAFYQLENDGDISTSSPNSAVVIDVGDWLTPKSNMNLFEASTTGTCGNTGWQNLGLMSRVYSITQPGGGGSRSCSFTLQIRDAATQTIRGTASITLIATSTR